MKISLMIMKKLYKDNNKMVYTLSDRSGYINAKINVKLKLEVGQVVEIEGVKDFIIDVTNLRVLEKFNIEDYLPTVDRPIGDIMNDIEDISKECIISPQAVKLNEYFFKDEDFLEKFKKGIGGVSMHHNYIG